MSETPEYAKALVHVLELRNDVARELVSSSPRFVYIAADHSDLFNEEATRIIVDAHVTAEVQRRLDEEAAAERRARVGR